MQPPVDHVLVRTTKPKAAAAVRVGAGLGQQQRVELAGLQPVCFARVEPWLQARKYVSAVASGLARRNGWTIAEQAGDRSPDKTQRLLNRAVWDTWGAMGVVRRFAVAGLDEAAARSGRRRALAIGALGETGEGTSGRGRAGAQRQEPGEAGGGGAEGGGGGGWGGGGGGGGRARGRGICGGPGAGVGCGGPGPPFPGSGPGGGGGGPAGGPPAGGEKTPAAGRSAPPGRA